MRLSYLPMRNTINAAFIEYQLMKLLLFQYISRCAAATIFFLLSVARAADEQIVVAPLPKEFDGSWVVNAVRINVEDGRRRYYGSDDAYLMRRRFYFNEKKISHNIENTSSCSGPQGGKLVRDANSLLGITMGRKSVRGPGEPATVEDFMLPLQGNTKVNAFILTCRNGMLGPGSSDRLPPPLNETRFDTWVALLSADEMAMRWYDDTILLLKREVRRAPRH